VLGSETGRHLLLLLLLLLPRRDGEATPEDAAAAFKGPWCCNQNAMHERLPRGWAGAEKNRCPLPCTVSTRPRAALETPTWLESAAARLCDANSRRRHLVLHKTNMNVPTTGSVSVTIYGQGLGNALPTVDAGLPKPLTAGTPRE